MKTAVKISDWLISNGAPADNREVYAYGAECLINSLAADILMLFLAFLAGRPFQMLIWLFFFTILRVNMGGYHADTHIKCILLSTLAGFTCIMIYPLFSVPLIVLLSLSSFISIIFMAPVIHENHPISEKRRKRAHIAAIFIGTGEMLCIAVSYKFDPGFSQLAFTAFYAAVLLGVMGFNNL